MHFKRHVSHKLLYCTHYKTYTAELPLMASIFRMQKYLTRVPTRSETKACDIMSERRRLFYWYVLLQKTGPSHYYCPHDQFAVRPNVTTIPYISVSTDSDE